MDFSASAFFGSGGDAHRVLAQHVEQWGPDDGVMVVIAKAADGKSILTDAGLENLERLTDALEDLEETRWVASLSNFELPTLDGGTLALKPAPKFRPTTSLGKQAWGARVLGDSALVPLLLSKDGKAASIVIQLDADSDNIGAMRPMIETIRATANEQAHFETTLAGTPVLRAALLDLILKDQVVFVPLAFLLMAILLGVLFRRFHGVALPLLGAALPSALVMGVMGYAGEPIGVVNQVYFTLLPVIAVSGGIHLLSRYYEEAERTGLKAQTLLPQDRSSALVETLATVGGACFFSAATTMIGLLSLQASPMHVLRGFGVYSAVGVLFAFATLVVLVPLILSVSKARTLNPDWQQRESQIDAVLAKAAHFPLNYPKSIVGGAIVLMLATGYFGSTVPVRNHISGMLEADHPVSQAGRVLDDKLGGQLSMEVDLRGPKGAFIEPEVLRVLDALEAKWSNEDGVRQVAGPARLLKRIDAGLTGEAGELPQKRETAAQLLFLVEGQRASEAVVNDAKDRARISLQMADIGGQRFEKLSDRMRADLDTRLGKIALPQGTVTGTVTGTALTSYLGINHLVRDLIQSVIAAFLLIAIIIGVIFKSPRIALLATVPNLLPQTMGLALLAALGWSLQPGTAVIFTIALGIAVDDTIHLLTRRKEERAQGRSRDDAIRRAMIRSGRPVVITTVILCAGFLVNGMSSFPTNATAGILGAFVVFSALIGDVFVLPAFLKLWGADAGAPPPNGEGPSNDEDASNKQTT